MPHPTHHLFLSYSRKDNRPSALGVEGWITAFCRRLQTTHQQLYEANPNSAQAADDLATSQERLATIQQGVQDWDAARGSFQQSLELRQVLFESNPNSIYVARRLVVVLYQMGKLGTQSRDNEYATQHLNLCFHLLDHCITSGMQFDPLLMQLHEQLRSIFQNRGDTQHENLH